MNDFAYDCLQRKRLAQQAKYRKCGSKSKKCSLPSDGLSHREWKERNSKVEMHDIKHPIRWALFKELDDDCKNEYIQYLVEQFCVNYKALANLFGVSVKTIQKYTEGLDATSSFRRGHGMTAAQRTEWERFISCGSQPNDAKDEETVSDETCGEVIQFVQTDGGQNGVQEHGEHNPTNHENMLMSSLAVSFTGKFDFNLVADALRKLIGEDAEGEIKIICNFSKSCLDAVG